MIYDLTQTVIVFKLQNSGKGYSILVVAMFILIIAFDLTLLAYFVLAFHKIKAPCDFILEESFVDIPANNVKHGVHGTTKTTYVSQQSNKIVECLVVLGHIHRNCIIG